jgi:hypothetical protein
MTDSIGFTGFLSFSVFEVRKNYKIEITRVYISAYKSTLKMSDLYLSLEILGYGFVSCCFIGMVACTAKSLKICYDKYILRLPVVEEPVNNPVHNLAGRYAKATVSIIYEPESESEIIYYADADADTDIENAIETNIIAVEII